MIEVGIDGAEVVEIETEVISDHHGDGQAAQGIEAMNPLAGFHGMRSLSTYSDAVHDCGRYQYNRLSLRRIRWNTLGARFEQLNHWLHRDLGVPGYDIAPASSDASFRRYFRVSFAGESRIEMDAPPDKEDTRPFAIARRLHEIGLHVPEILAEDERQGFLLLSDLGSRQYLPELNSSTEFGLTAKNAAANVTRLLGS